MSVTSAEIQGSAGLASAGGPPGGPAAAEAGTGITFSDVLDAINPLQHIAVLSSIYRGLTGTTIAAPARLIGDTLFGGPLGFIGFVVNSVLEGTTGKDMGGHVLAWFQGAPKGSPETGPLLADAGVAAAPPAASDAGQSPPIAAIDGGADDIAQEARLFAAASRESARRSLDYRSPAPPPSGGISAEGGWFSDVMLSALARYEAAAKLRADDSPGRTFDQKL